MTVVCEYAARSEVHADMHIMVKFTMTLEKSCIKVCPIINILLKRHGRNGVIIVIMTILTKELILFQKHNFQAPIYSFS